MVGARAFVPDNQRSVLTILLVFGSQQKSPEPERAVIVSEEGKTSARQTESEPGRPGLTVLLHHCPPGSVATAEDPAAITNIQSAATFPDQPVKYLFKTEGAGGQVGRKQTGPEGGGWVHLHLRMLSDPLCSTGDLQGDPGGRWAA